MNRRGLFLYSGLALSGCVERAARSYQAEPAVHAVAEPVYEGPEWDYKAIMAGAPMSEDDLKSLGQRGWELCGVDRGTHFFKRPGQ